MNLASHAVRHYHPASSRAAEIALCLLFNPFTIKGPTVWRPLCGTTLQSREAMIVVQDGAARARQGWERILALPILIPTFIHSSTNSHKPSCHRNLTQLPPDKTFKLQKAFPTNFTSQLHQEPSPSFIKNPVPCTPFHPYQRQDLFQLPLLSSL